MTLEEGAHQPRDRVAFLLEGEVAGVEQVELDVLQVPRYGWAPSAGKIGSFLPQTISVGGWCARKYACHSG